MSLKPNLIDWAFLEALLTFWTYVLQSENTRKIYIGHTSDLGRRLREHNDKAQRKSKYTRKNKGPWQLIHSEQHKARIEAMKREKFLKSGQGREWLYREIINC